MSKPKQVQCGWPDCDYTGHPDNGIPVHNGIVHDGEDPPEEESDGRGRPTKKTEATVNKIEQAAAIGCNMTEIAAYAEISRETLYTWLEEDKELSDRVERKKQKPVLKAKKTIYEKLDHSFDNALKYLERVKSGEFSKQMQHSGPEGQEFSIKIESYDPETDSTTETETTTEAGEGMGEAA